MENTEVQQWKVFIIAEIIEDVPNEAVIKTTINKKIDNVNAVSFNSGENLTKKISLLDTFIQSNEGRFEILIDQNNY